MKLYLMSIFVLLLVPMFAGASSTVVQQQWPTNKISLGMVAGQVFERGARGVNTDDYGNKGLFASYRWANSEALLEYSEYDTSASRAAFSITRISKQWTGWGRWIFFDREWVAMHLGAGGGWRQQTVKSRFANAAIEQQGLKEGIVGAEMGVNFSWKSLIFGLNGRLNYIYQREEPVYVVRSRFGVRF